MNCVVCNNIIDDDSCFCKWCGIPIEVIPWIEEDGIDYTKRIPFMTFWREHGEMSVYKRIDDEGNLHSCILFEDKDGHHTIVNFNCWIGAAHTLRSTLVKDTCLFIILLMAVTRFMAIRPMIIVIVRLFQQIH